MELKWGNGKARLNVLAPDVVRLRICEKKFAPDKSWAVVAQPNCSMQSSPAELRVRSEDQSWQLMDDKRREILSGRQIGFVDGRGFLRINLQPRDRVFGLGETSGPMDKRGLRRELWNIDVLGHSPGIHPRLLSLYVSIPFAILWRDGRAVGIFWDNPARQVWDMGRSNPNEMVVEADLGEINLYFFSGPTIAGIVQRYAELTGCIPLPPRWALGYHQCRYSYETSARVLEVARNFRERQIPCDAIYLDIHHMNEYRVFTFGAAFPEPAKLTADLAANGFQTVAIVDPGVKCDRRFGVFQRGVKARAFVKEPNGKRDYVGNVWPGLSRFPDFLHASVRRWWGREQKILFKLGVAGVWNDMNEPANFALPSKTLPPDCRHLTDFGPASHAEIHNVYGMQMARASREGALAMDETVRPFVITRAGYAGIQRYALVWTGDNSSSWEHLADTIPSLLNLSVSGVPFCGVDVGGFLENATGELLARWTQVGCLTPFFRNHSNEGTRAQEPWAFGEDVEAVCRAAIQWRYQMLPYLYSLFERATRDGAPVMRPLLWHYQNDPMCAAVQDQFLLGEQLLVAPIIQPGARARSVYLPPGTWHDFWSLETYRGRAHALAEGPLSLLPIYAKAGAIIPFAPLVQHTGEYSTAEVTLQIWPGADGEFEFYDDDGRTRFGAEYRRKIQYFSRDRGGVIRFGQVAGKYRSVKKWRVVLHRCHSRSLPYYSGQEIAFIRDREHQFISFELPERRSEFEVTVA